MKSIRRVSSSRVGKSLAAGVAVGLMSLSVAVAGDASGSPQLAGPPPKTVLYSQLDGSFGVGYVSEIFYGGFAQYRALGADDFVVPEGRTWTVSGVEAVGRYHEQGGRDASVLVSFYDSDGTTPGARLALLRFPHPAGPHYRLDFANRPVTLESGTYWLSLQVISPSGSSEAPFWTWTTRTTANGAGAVWRNPADGFNEHCQNWTPVPKCYGNSIGPDFLFAVKGSTS